MKYYTLLRNNEKSGPFSHDEVSHMPLKRNDLLWIEGESSKWNYPSNMEELRTIVKYEEKEVQTHVAASLKTNESKIYVSLPAALDYGRTYGRFHQNSTYENSPEPETTFSQPLKVTEEHDTNWSEERKYKFESNNVKSSYALKIIASFLALIFSAFIFKKIMESSDLKAVALPKVTTAALPLEHSPGIEENKAVANAGPDYQNALTTEVVVPDKLEPKTPKKVKPKNLAKSVDLKGSDYKVGFLGGIDDLRLLVLNHSDFNLDKVEVEVEYLKPNGKKAKTDFYELTSIPAKGSKTLDVPPSNRGVKVKYHITNILSKEHKNLVEL